MRFSWRFLGWFILVAALIGLYGEVTAPLLLMLAADVAVARLIVVEMAGSGSAAGQLLRPR